MRAQNISLQDYNLPNRIGSDGNCYEMPSEEPFGSLLHHPKNLYCVYFCKMTIGSSTPNIELGSRVPLIEAMPIADGVRSNEWITRGKRIKPDGSASIAINNESVAQLPVVFRRQILHQIQYIIKLEKTTP